MFRNTFQCNFIQILNILFIQEDALESVARI